MNTAMSRWIDGFSGLDVLVIGEAMLDRYLIGTTGRLCREGPVPIVALSACHDSPGGAANTAVNARALGARVTLLSVVGDDPEGQALRHGLDERGVDAEAVFVDPRRRTLAKNRVVAESQLLVRYDHGSTDPLDPATEEALIDRLSGRFALCDAVIVSDYGYGILGPRVIAALADLQARTPRVLVADSKDLAAYRRAGLTAVKPNYEEALTLTGRRARGASGARADEIAACGDRILKVSGARLAAVTLDTEGAIVLERDRPPYRTYARPTRHSLASGAGDTFLAALSLALAAGADTPAASDLASAAAAVVVGREGTSSCSARELKEHVSAEGKVATSLEGLSDRLELYRRAGRRVVFTNGCFDILHRGHISYLSRAKALGDILVVGVNSDESIRRLKGPSRPINALDDRVQVLAALSCVDHLVSFDEDTPCDLIRVVRPDVFVKGGDYTRERLPEAAIVEELGGVVQIMPLVADRSTTDIIERIRLSEAGPPKPRRRTAAIGRGDLA